MPQVMKAQTRDARAANRSPERLLEGIGDESTEYSSGG
jgi:hypothetical protein